MPNSTNTTWIVSYVKFEMNRNGMPMVLHCDSRSYRSEQYLKNHYHAIIGSLEDQGYSLSEIKKSENDIYYGMQGKLLSSVSGREKAIYVVVFVDRNPVWDPRP